MRSILSLFLALVSSALCSAEKYVHSFYFNESDYSISPSRSDSLLIKSLVDPARYPDPDEPGLPIVGRSLAFIGSANVVNYSFSFNKRLIRSGVDVKNSSDPITTEMLPEDAPPSLGEYENKSYPSSNCIMTSSSKYGCTDIINFNISPFVFDATERNLYFIDSLTVDLEIDYIDDETTALPLRSCQIDILRSFIDNPEVLDFLPVALSEPDIEDRIDYIIITGDSLKEAFKPLAEWKRVKGVPSKIITVEDIYKSYSGADSLIKIKTCIKDYFENHYTQYVLLGGDVDLIPTKICIVEKDFLKLDFASIPTDVYFSCIEDIDWGNNANVGSHFEPSKNISVVPVVSVTRVPVRTTSDVAAFVNRTIEYEQSPKYERTLFQGGTVLKNQVEEGETIYVSGERFADMIFNNVIVGKIIMGNTKFFETFTYSGEPFSSEMFNRELEKGYQFVEIISHGSSKAFASTNILENYRKIFFTANQASNLHNSGHTLLTTTACLTNEFDSEESNLKSNPCLSEALIRNPDSGIIGYLGSSKQGWYSADYSMDYSPKYEEVFYDYLLNDSYRPYAKNFGTLVNFTKSAFLSLLEYRGFPSYRCKVYRWLHYALNPIGDPEMPIYNANPKYFDGASVHVNRYGLVEVHTGVENARVCVSKSDDPSVYYIGYGNDVKFDLPDGVLDIWITHQNHRPKHFRFSKSEIIESNIESQSEIVSISVNPASATMTVKYPVKYVGLPVQVSIVNTESGLNRQFDITDSYGTATVDVSGIPGGVYVASVCVDGRLTDGTKRVIINR